MDYPNFLEFRQYRYLKMASLLVVTVSVAYVVYTDAAGGSYGGTWFGYVSGTLAAAMVLFLAWYGVRKRRVPVMPERRRVERRGLFADGEQVARNRRRGERREHRHNTPGLLGGTLQEWLSAHAYLGLAVLMVATLHAGFRLDWNVHGLGYGLLVLVVASGFYGAFVYIHLPGALSANLGDDTLEGIRCKIGELDELARLRAEELTDEVKALVTAARLETRILGGLYQRLADGRSGCPTERAVRRVQELGTELIHGDQPRQIHDLYLVLLQKQQLLHKARTHLRLERHLRVWLYLHTPLSIGLLAAIVVHVLTILMYW